MNSVEMVVYKRIKITNIINSPIRDEEYDESDLLKIIAFDGVGNSFCQEVFSYIAS